VRVGRVNQSKDRDRVVVPLWSASQGFNRGQNELSKALRICHQKQRLGSFHIYNSWKRYILQNTGWSPRLCRFQEARTARIGNDQPDRPGVRESQIRTMTHVAAERTSSDPKYVTLVMTSCSSTSADASFAKCIL
jgi:hypothetical protein